MVNGQSKGVSTKTYSRHGGHERLQGANGHQELSNDTHQNGDVLARPPASRKESSPLMPAFMVSAPGKVIVFGEHAVVHGKVIPPSTSLYSHLFLRTADTYSVRSRRPQSPLQSPSAPTFSSPHSPSRAAQSLCVSRTYPSSTLGTLTTYPGRYSHIPPRRNSTTTSSQASTKTSSKHSSPMC